jgi:molybdopterin-guanine dinucleotide biosynthesis protein A
MSSLTGIVLASGKGSRMEPLTKELGVPKHLLPIGEETLITRICHQLSHDCEVVLHTCPIEHEDAFKKALQDEELKVATIIAREGFLGDFTVILKHLKQSTTRIAIVTGDLVFDDEQLKRFLEKSKKRGKTIVLGLRNGDAKLIDPAISAISFPLDFLEEVIKQNINPENIKEVILFALKQVFQRGIIIRHLPVLANINTPQDYNELTTKLKL